MPDTLKDYNSYRKKMNRKLSPIKTKVMEMLSIAILVGGTIAIPHLRQAYEFWELLESS